MIPQQPHTEEQSVQHIWKILEEVKDPEVPVLSILDLGILRSVTVQDNNVCIVITPTYSGCPALDVISMDIRLKLIEHGYKNVVITQSLTPAWSTDWMTVEGKRKLQAFGIAPPLPRQQFCTTEMFAEEAVPCPRCQSYQTEVISQFSSTACKAMYRCRNCSEAFDYFKCH